MSHSTLRINPAQKVTNDKKVTLKTTKYTLGKFKVLEIIRYDFNYISGGVSLNFREWELFFNFLLWDKQTYLVKNFCDMGFLNICLVLKLAMGRRLKNKQTSTQRLGSYMPILLNPSCANVINESPLIAPVCSSDHEKNNWNYYLEYCYYYDNKRWWFSLRNTKTRGRNICISKNVDKNLHRYSGYSFNFL